MKPVIHRSIFLKSYLPFLCFALNCHSYHRLRRQQTTVMRKDKAWRDAVLNLVKNLNNFNYKEACKLYKCVPFYVGDKKVGVVELDKLKQLLNYPDVFVIESHENDTMKYTAVRLHDALSTVEERDKALASVFEDLRAKEAFVSLKGWRNERFSIYYNRADEPLFHLERSACAVLGVIQYGAHVNGYTFQDGKLKMWIGRRSPTKPTYPNMLDNMCAGGIPEGLTVRECAEKECHEEGSVEDSLLENLKSVGCISYCYKDRRGVLAETEFLFDLELPPDFVPCNADGEVQGFELFTIEQIQNLIIEEQFKPNCAMVVVDFLIRHGYITHDDDPNYTYLQELMHVSIQPAV